MDPSRTPRGLPNPAPAPSGAVTTLAPPSAGRREAASDPPDRSARLERSWKLHWQELYRYFRQTGADDACARECVLDTFAVAFQWLDTVEECEIRKWLLAAARYTRCVRHAAWTGAEALRAAPAPGCVEPDVAGRGPREDEPDPSPGGRRP